ncbi:MAG: hypothetical protein JWM53_5548 [bacterium]|nr:hypothetical protein [bacterium]
MSPESLLAEKLAAYRGRFDEACRGLFSSGEGVTLEYEQDDDDDAVDVTPARAPVDTDVSNAGSNSSNAGSNSAGHDGAAVKRELRGAVRWIAEDFAHEFNAKLTAAARTDPSVELVADKYEMGSEHTDELTKLLAAPIGPLLAKLDAGDLDGARRATLEAWPLLERRIRVKWQAYFVLTFQDVSVERKAATDRRKLQSRFDPKAADVMARAQAARDSMSDFAPALDEPKRAMSPWIAVVALLLIAATGGWLLMRGHLHHASVSGAARP